jgi:hypothetical protein
MMLGCCSQGAAVEVWQRGAWSQAAAVEPYSTLFNSTPDVMAG